MTAHLVGRAVDEFAVWSRRHVDAWRARKTVAAVDEQRDEHLAAAFGQAPRELRRGRNAAVQADQHFGCGTAVGQSDHIGAGGAGWFEKQSLGVHSRQDSPTDGVDGVAAGACQDSRAALGGGGRGHELQARLGAFVAGPDNGSEARAVRGHRGHVLCLGRRVPMPVSTPACDRYLGLAHQVPVDARDHERRQIAGHVKERRPRQDSGLAHWRGMSLSFCGMAMETVPHCVLDCRQRGPGLGVK